MFGDGGWGGCLRGGEFLTDKAIMTFHGLFLESLLK